MREKDHKNIRIVSNERPISHLVSSLHSQRKSKEHNKKYNMAFET